jgi:hypothetical protein
MSLYVTLQVLPDEKQAALRIRPATPDDADAIGRVQQRNGVDSEGAASPRDFRQSYPFEAEFQDIPIGWVLETDGGSIVGSIGNVHMLYELGGRRLRAGIATAWAVDQGHRGKSVQLMTTFLRQKGVDFCVNGSANPAASQVMTGLKIPRIPLPDYGTSFFWAIRRHAFARAALMRRQARAAVLLAWPAAAGVLARDVIFRSGRGRPSGPVRRLREFDERFDSLWNQIGAGPVRLRAVRTRAVLDWRFGGELRSGRAIILATERGALLSGYAVLIRREGSELGMNLFDVADIQAAEDDGATIRDLLLGSIRAARDDGADALKFMTGTPVKRSAAEALRPWKNQLPFWQLYYKAATPELGSMLSAADVWDFSLFETY